MCRLKSQVRLKVFGSQLKKQAQLRESALAGLVMLMICYASYSTFYSPRKAEAVDLETQIAETTTKKIGQEKLNKMLQQKFDEQNKLRNQQVQIVTKRNTKYQMLKNKKDSAYSSVSEFLYAVTQPGFKVKTEILSMKYDKPLNRAGYTEAGFTVNATGRFNEIIEFIGRFEKVQALVTIDKVNISINPKDSNMVLLSINGTFFKLETDNNV